jgi:N utilization substance protein B
MIKKNFLRSIGRAYALQALYQNELNPQTREFQWEGAPEDEETPNQLSSEEQKVAVDFARLLYEGVVDRKGEIDHILNAAFDKGRTIELTAPVDRCVLRLAAYEMLFVKTPRAVVISQAIELGAKFGDVRTSAFVNGVLDQIGRGSNSIAENAPPSSDA